MVGLEYIYNKLTQPWTIIARAQLPLQLPRSARAEARDVLVNKATRAHPLGVVICTGALLGIHLSRTTIGLGVPGDTGVTSRPGTPGGVNPTEGPGETCPTGVTTTEP